MLVPPFNLIQLLKVLHTYLSFWRDGKSEDWLAYMFILDVLPWYCYKIGEFYKEIIVFISLVF